MSSENIVPAWARQWENTEESRDWYYWRKPGQERKWGSIQRHAKSGLLYAVISLSPIALYCFIPQRMRDLFLSEPWIPIVWVILLALTYPLFVWKEAVAFERWFAHHMAEADTLKASEPAEGDKQMQALKEQQRWFYQNARYVEGFWKTLGGIYAAVGLLALVQKPAEIQNAKDVSMAIAIESTDKALAGAAQSIEETKKAVEDIKLIEACIID